MSGFKVIYYETRQGERVVEVFINSLSKGMRAKIAMEFNLLQEYGHLLREPYSKHLKDGIFELRCHFGEDNVRLLYFFDRGRIVVVTNGFEKKGRKTPRGEIKIALKRRRDYLNRREER